MNQRRKVYKKLFVSIPVERHFLRVFSKYRDRHGVIPYLRFTPVKKLHITVLYIGPVVTTEVQNVHDCIAAAVEQHREFSLILEKVTYAPPGRPASMVWAYLEDDGTLTALSQAIASELRVNGIVPEDTHKGTGRKTFIPHITLARFTDKVVHKLSDLRRTELEGYAHVVKEIELLESVNGTSKKSDSEYRKIGSFKLGNE